jgi:hypothetical protein
MLTFGAPYEIITDRANCFSAEIMAEYLQLQQTNHFPSTPYHPQTNGMVERVNGVLGNILTKLTLGTREKWDEFLPSAVFIINARKHSTTGFSPFFLAYGLHPRLPGDIFPPAVYSKSSSDVEMQTHRELTRLGQYRALALKQSQNHAAEYAKTNGSKEKTFVVGEYVSLKNFAKMKFQFRRTGPFIVDRIGPHNTYYLMQPNGELLSNPYNGRDLEPWKGGILSDPDNLPVPPVRVESLLCHSSV